MPGRVLVAALVVILVLMAAASALTGEWAIIAAFTLAALVVLAALALNSFIARKQTNTSANSSNRADELPSAHITPGGDADGRPLGDTPEAHDELSPHDLPVGHPGRPAAERQSGGDGGTTHGNTEGGAASADDRVGERH